MLVLGQLFFWGLGLGLVCCVLGLGLVPQVLVNITVYKWPKLKYEKTLKSTYDRLGMTL